MSRQKSTAQRNNTPVFYLTQELILQVVGNPDIKVDHVVALLSVASGTERTGIYSSMGIYGVRKRVGMSIDRATRVMQELEVMDVIKNADKLHPKSKVHKNMPHREGKAKVRWIINMIDDSRKVWFSSRLVNGHGHWKTPLRSLQTCGELAARLLLLAHIFEDVLTYGGVDPAKGFCTPYLVSERASSRYYTLYHSDNYSMNDPFLFPSDNLMQMCPINNPDPDWLYELAWVPKLAHPLC